MNFDRKIEMKQNRILNTYKGIYRNITLIMNKKRITTYNADANININIVINTLTFVNIYIYKNTIICNQ